MPVAEPHEAANALVSPSERQKAAASTHSISLERSKIEAAVASKRGMKLDIEALPNRMSGFRPIAPLYRVEHAFARLGPMAAAVALLRGDRGEREGVARGRSHRLPAHTPAGVAAIETRAKCAADAAVSMRARASLTSAGFKANE
jgi:hypothetical protein